MRGCLHRLHLWNCRDCRVRREVTRYMRDLSEWDRLAAKARARRAGEGEAWEPGGAA